MVKTESGRFEAVRRLGEHGYEPLSEPHFDEYFEKYVIDFVAPRDEQLDFLRPDILPPRG